MEDPEAVIKDDPLELMRVVAAHDGVQDGVVRHDVVLVAAVDELGVRDESCWMHPSRSPVACDKGGAGVCFPQNLLALGGPLAAKCVGTAVRPEDVKDTGPGRTEVSADAGKEPVDLGISFEGLEDVGSDD